MTTGTKFTIDPELQAIYDILLKTYRERDLIPRRDPMHELISTMLSHRTTHANEELAFKRMWTQFKSWETIRDAPVNELIHAIRSSTFPETKAPNIQTVLARIIDERGEANIDFLADLHAYEGLEWLTALPGVGIKTASLVLLFCFTKPVLPVDTHVHRISKRLGLIGENVSTNKAHKLLLAMFPPDAHTLYNFHVTMQRHGQRVCTWKNPRCNACPLQVHCAYINGGHAIAARGVSQPRLL